MNLLLLAISKKYGGLCVAGIDYDTLKYIRIGHANNLDSPECGPIQPHELNINGRQCQILDVINIDVKKMVKNGCQIENYNLIRINYYVKRVKKSEISEIYKKIKRYNYVFYNTRKKLYLDEIKNVKRSLCFIKVKDLSIERRQNGKQMPAPYASFTYNERRYNDLSVTDALVCAYPNPYCKTDLNGTKLYAHLGNHSKAYIMVSLPYDKWSLDNNGFFKYVSGVIIVDNTKSKR